MKEKRGIIFTLLIISILMLISATIFSENLGNALFLFYILPGIMLLTAAYISIKRNKENKS